MQNFFYRYVTLGRLKVGRIPEKSVAKLCVEQAVFRFIQCFFENLQQPQIAKETLF